MNSLIKRKNPLASSPQIKSQESIIPTIQFAKCPPTFESIQSQIFKLKQQKNVTSLNQPSLSLQTLKNQFQTQANQVSQTTNHKQTSQQIIWQTIFDKQKNTYFNQKQEQETQLKKSYLPTSSNLNQNKDIKSKINGNQFIAKADLIDNSKIEQNKSIFQQVRPLSTSTLSISQIKKQNYAQLRNIMSAKISFPSRKLQIKSSQNQKFSYQKQASTQNFIIQQDKVQNTFTQQEEEGEEEKERFDSSTNERENYIDKVLKQNLLQNENETHACSVFYQFQPPASSLCPLFFEDIHSDINFLTLEQFQSPVLKQPPPFFEIMNYKIVLRILNYLPVEDLIKFATLSKYSRSLVATALKRFDYQMKILKFQRIMNKDKFSAIQRIKEIMQNFDNYLKDQQDFENEFLYFLRKIHLSQYKYCVYAILQAGMNYSNNEFRQNIDVISNLQNKGILSCFSGIHLPFIAPSSLEIELPSSLPLKNSKFDQFIKIIYDYVKFRKNNKVSIKQQKKAVQQMEQYQVRNKYMKGRLKLLSMYMKPVQRLRESKNIFDYINKNILQAIIRFLDINEIAILFQSGKTMREIAKSAIQSQLTLIKSNRVDQLYSLGLHKQFGDGILYAKQFEQFKINEGSKISSQSFSNAPLCEILKAICYSLTTKTIEEVDAQFKAYPTIIYKVNLNYTVPHPDRLLLINSFLEKYPSLKEFIQKGLNYHKVSQNERREYILLYLTMKGLQKLAQFRETYKSYEDANVSYDFTISPLDKIIFKYQRLLGTEEDEIYMIPQLQSQRWHFIFEEEEEILNLFAN